MPEQCPTCGQPVKRLEIHICALYVNWPRCAACDTRHPAASLYDGLCAKCWAERMALAVESVFDD